MFKEDQDARAIKQEGPKKEIEGPKIEEIEDDA